MDKKTLTTEEAAVALGVTPARIRQLITEGKLPAQRFGRAHVIRETDLSLVEDRKVGRPPNAKTAPAKANGAAKKPAAKKGGKR